MSQVRVCFVVVVLPRSSCLLLSFHVPVLGLVHPPSQPPRSRCNPHPPRVTWERPHSHSPPHPHTPGVNPSLSPKLDFSPLAVDLGDETSPLPPLQQSSLQPPSSVHVTHCPRHCQRPRRVTSASTSALSWGGRKEGGEEKRLARLCRWERGREGGTERGSDGNTAELRLRNATRHDACVGEWVSGWVSGCCRLLHKELA